MTNKHHSVLMVEGNLALKKTLHRWLHVLERDIEIDEVETAAEAKDHLRHRSPHDYDLVIADEFLPGSDTGLELFRHCAAEYPALPFLMTAQIEMAEYGVLPQMIDAKDPHQGVPLIARMLDQKPFRERELAKDSRRLLWATMMMVAGLIALKPNLENVATTILQNPPFTDRFIIEPALPESVPLPQELLAPPPPRNPHSDVPFDLDTVFTPALKAQMRVILERADEIVLMAQLGP